MLHSGSCNAAFYWGMGKISTHASWDFLIYAMASDGSLTPHNYDISACCSALHNQFRDPSE